MKYPVFALFALSIFYWAACQNTPTPGSTDASGSIGEPVADVGPTPSSDPAALNQQIIVDFLAARRLSHKYDSSYQQAADLVKNMKSTFRALGDANKDKVAQLNDRVIKFTVAYYDHRHLTDEMDSLNTKLTAGQIDVANAQKEYVRLRGPMNAAGKRLESTPVDVAAWKQEYDAIFSEANKKASGGQ